MDEADKVTSEAPRSLDSDVRFRADSNGNLKLPDYTHQAIQFSVGPFPGFSYKFSVKVFVIGDVSVFVCISKCHDRHEYPCIH